MRDNTDPVNAHEHGAAVFGIIRLLLYFIQAGQYRIKLRNLVLEFHQGAHKTAGQEFSRAFHYLENYVTYKSFADNHLAIALEEVIAFNITGEIYRGFFHQRPGFLDQFVALGILFADIKQADPGVIHLPDMLGINRGHNAVLEQMNGVAENIGADIYQISHAFFSGQGNRNTGPFDTGQESAKYCSAGHGRSGIAGRNHRIGFFLFGIRKTSDQRGIGLLPDGLYRRLIHPDYLRGLNNLYILGDIPVGMFFYGRFVAH